MNAIRARQNPIGPTATSMKGLRRPSGVWKVSLHGPITSGSVEREGAFGGEHERDQRRRAR